jgi:hypothetical protein
MSAYEGVEGTAPPFLTSALDAGVISFTPLSLYPRGNSIVTHLVVCSKMTS